MILYRSEEERKLVKLHVGWNVSNLTSVDGYLVGQHARGWDFDGVCPVIVVITKSVGEVQDSVFRNL